MCPIFKCCVRLSMKRSVLMLIIINLLLLDILYSAHDNGDMNPNERLEGLSDVVAKKFSIKKAKMNDQH